MNAMQMKENSYQVFDPETKSTIEVILKTPGRPTPAVFDSLISLLKEKNPELSDEAESQELEELEEMPLDKAPDQKTFEKAWAAKERLKKLKAWRRA